MEAPVAATTARPAEPWRRRFVRELLYGKQVDRTTKMRARLGLTILIFVLGYLSSPLSHPVRDRLRLARGKD